MKSCIAVDVGGTKMLVAQVREDASVAGVRRYVTAGKKKEQVMAEILENIRDYENTVGWENGVMPDTVGIGEKAFSGTYIKSITIPESVAKIGKYAFGGYGSLESVRISSLEAWCNIEFGDESANPLARAKNLYIGDSITPIKEIVIPDTVTEIKDYAFYRWNGTSVTLHENVTSIGVSAFRLCTDHTSITIPASVTSIGDGAFGECYELTSVTFENTTGWWRASSSTATSGTVISVTELADPAKAAMHLSSGGYWKRTVE